MIDRQFLHEIINILADSGSLEAILMKDQEASNRLLDEAIKNEKSEPHRQALIKIRMGRESRR